jgi:hypothetical protein
MTLTGLPHSEISGSGCQHLTGAYRSVATSFIGLRRQGIHPAPLLVGVLCLLRFGLRSRAWDRNVSVFANSAVAHKAVGGHLRRGAAVSHVGFVIYVDYRMWLVRC